MTVESFNGDTTVDGFVEVRGMVTSDNTMEFREYSKYNDQYNLDQYDEMVNFFQGMCKQHCVE